MEQAWGGAKAFDWYGVGDTGSIAGEGPERDGLYVWEDAQYLELLDVDSGQPVAPGGTGDMVVTCLYKHDIAPCIRFNTHDITHELGGRGELGFKRIAGFKVPKSIDVIPALPRNLCKLAQKSALISAPFCCASSSQVTPQVE